MLLLIEFVLGNVWAQEWASVYNLTVPYPNKASVDVTPAMVAQVLILGIHE